MLKSLIALNLCVAAMLMVLGNDVAAGEPSPALKTVIDAAKKEGSLNISWGQSVLGGASGAKKLEAAMNAMYGTHIHLNFAPGPSMISQAQNLLLQQEAGQKADTDVYIAWSQSLTQLIDRNALMEVDWKALLPQRIRPEFIEGNGRLLRLGVTFPVVVYNTQRAPMIPKTLEDMLRPEWKGKFAVNSYAAGFEVLSAHDVWGHDKTFHFMRRLSEQAGGLIRCGADVERVATGEFAALVMDCIGGNTITWQERGAPLDFVIPADAAELDYYFMTIPKNATDPDAAKLFTTFMLTSAGQKLNWDTWKMDLDGLPGSKMGAMVNKLQGQGTKFTRITFDWWVKHPEVAKQQADLIKTIERK